ncbi:MAG: LysR family transcriptional regulator [Sphingomonas sp.]
MLSSDDLAFFAVISTSRSLVAAARALNITPSAVTQRLKTVEARAGVRLMDRSSRHMCMTDEGAMVAAHGTVVADAIEALAEELRIRSKVVSGHLRVAAPHGFGRLHIAPAIDAFARLHPRVTLTLDLLDHPGARLADSYDLVIHIGPPGPLEAIVTTLAENRRYLCASPDYLDCTVPIRSPDDLLHHRCVALRENEEDVTLWHFRRGVDENATVRISPGMSSNDGSVVRGWALTGRGIVIRSEWDVADDLASGRLRRVLPDWEVPAADVVAILGPRHGRSGRTSAFLALLRLAFAMPPWR